MTSCQRLKIFNYIMDKLDGYSAMCDCTCILFSTQWTQTFLEKIPPNISKDFLSYKDINDTVDPR